MTREDIERIQRWTEVLNSQKDLADYNTQFITAKEVAAYMGCSVVEARNIMRREGFPAVKVGKAFKVMRSALVEWAHERRTS